MNALHHALEYRRRGWMPVPLGYRQKGIKTPGWQNLRLTEDELPQHFGGRCNVGVLLGEPSGWLIDVDLDNPVAVELAPEYLPPTGRIFGRTSKPRSHWLYRVTAPIETKQFKAKPEGMLVELRATGLQTVFPGSIHESGEVIAWDEEGEPDEVDPIELLDCVTALAEAVRRRLGITEQPRHNLANVTSVALPQAENRVERCRKYLEKMNPGIAGQGGHDATFAAACKCFEFGLDDAQARELLQEFNTRCQPPWNDRELAHKLDDAKMKVGGNFGCKLTEDRYATTYAAGEKCGDDSLLFDEGRTEAANARRLISLHGRDVRYIPAWDEWLAWDGSRWQQDATCCSIQAKAKSVANQLWGDVKRLCQGMNTDEADKKKIVASMRSFARSSNSAKSVAHTIELARSEPGIPLSHDALDKSPMLLNVANGTIDLTTGKIRPHDRADLITKQAPVVFDPNAECPLWRKFLRDAFLGDDELIRYVRRLVGYCLSGSTKDHVLPFLYGTGANGKSVFTSTILALLGGDYSMRSAPELLMAKGNVTHPTERADLFRKRLVISNEIEAGSRLNEALVKDLTGGDAIRARHVFEDFWQFDPTHKVWMVGNHRPNIRGTDNGIWRRVKQIPFERIFAEHEQDKDLPAKLQRELSGILNWALLGCLEWQAEGLGEPEAVRKATAEYRQEQDIVAAFLDERCQIQTDARVKAAALYSAYRAWSEASGEPPIGKKTFGAEIGRRFKRITSNGTWYVGIGLVDSSQTAQV